ncbi:MAG: YeeE/YedE thiosulfate transporter family protein [Gemmatimonadota bacterium]|nr:YeeE/YedE thiosulfate transporter family protein [Gemmatimonadota bacterium]
MSGRKTAHANQKGVGAVDLGRIELPATFLLPQLAGGLVFGAGFVIGGYCPGTGCVGFASGRLDALMLVAGMVTGVYVFGEVFPLVADFYTATPLGPATLADMLQVRFGVASAMIAALGLLALAGAEWVERRFHPAARLGKP